jgi:alpha-D-ribose 1-methylphosphonate 5-triphosphate diphosphatase
VSPDGSHTVETRFDDVTLVTTEGAVRGSVTMAQGVFIAVEVEPAGGPRGEPWNGDFLLPGLIDIHTDHVEKHVFPRSHVLWDFATAIMAHDSQVAAGGVTTVFDAICVGAAMQKQERRKILTPMLGTLEDLTARDMLRAEHLVHLRCEISDPATPELAEAVIDGPLVRAMSLMDHTPGDRQSPDVERYIVKSARDMQVSVAEMRDLTAELIERSARVGAAVRARLAAMARDRALPLMSHDDASPAHVAMAAGEGAAISEFPTTLEAARAAKAAGLRVVAGAPNVLRGGSQSGNVAVSALLGEGLVDMLASDYVPRSMVDAVFAVAEDPALPQDLHDALALTTAAPAAAMGLGDRGAVREGLRADFIRVRRQPPGAQVRAVWRAGRRVA